ncbi:GNAT family N-acetyltransferase [Sphingomonas sp. SRS2]|uniref:GNAT family N-acetyltransferase n=1 Tax=Sphingomonas sp. SRS2 TaxID=133190 RepID=UPI00061843BF|nr:GNAT family N-acetyltransferase [Sphingomonas sp. SRS2]KKC27975.1 acetyltransferase [Sphingomonas sp. SRS2]
MTEIRTARLLMRRARPADMAAMHEILSDPRAMRYWSSVPHSDIEVTRDWMADMVAPPPGRGDDFIIEHDGRVIGKLGAWKLPELGYIFAPEMWGRGFAAEALAAFIDYIFAGPTDYLTADVDPRNAGSLALLAKLGFRESHRAARTWLVGDEWCDSVYLRLDRPSA